VLDEREDLLTLSDYAWGRLRDRMAGLTEDEYRWAPVTPHWTVRAAGDGTFRSDGGRRAVFTTLPWRLHHITDTLGTPRNARVLRRADAPVAVTDPAGDAAGALVRLADAYAVWRAVLAGIPAGTLVEPMGAVAGPYGESTGRAYVLHVLDELIHHGAEAALLRDLYAAR
jgi:hypothetical protein